MIIGLCFYIRWFTLDDSDTRGRLYVSMMLLIISLSLIAIWNIFYFIFLYKHQVVYVGADVIGYINANPKGYIGVFAFVTIVINLTFAYFMCVGRTYMKALDGDKEPEGIETPGMPSF